MLLFLLYASGTRRGELAELSWKNLQPSGETGQITVFGKGGKTRSIQLPESVWKQFLKLRGKAGPEEPVFPSRKKRKPPDRIRHLEDRETGREARGSRECRFASIV